MKIRIKLNDACDHALIALELPSRITVQMDADALSKFIAQLADARSRMTPPVPNDPPTTATVRGIPAPRIEVEGEAMLGHGLVHLRDPRYGWLHYSLPHAQSRQVGEALLRRAGTVLVKKPGAKAN
jgi:hypothetical protein